MLVLLGALALAAVSPAHIERASYFPDPAPDTSVSPPAGGAVPEIRSLGSALDPGPPGNTWIVCQSDSLQRLQSSINQARASGYYLRPYDRRQLSAAEANHLLQVNQALFARCTHNEIQVAVNRSRNNDRIVIMPGLYTEPTARAKPTNDPRCDGPPYEIENDRSQAGAVSYAYQARCPNDQNLIAVLGRTVGTGTDPQPPLDDRRGIPNLGRCIRCNIQIEGSGVSPNDVVIDAGRVASGNGAPIGAVKDVGIRADRADGFVLRNVLVRHAHEHNVYVLEVDGYQLDRLKVFYPGEYGVLTFTADHGLIQNCDAAGAGDAGLYPGSGADTQAQRPPGTDPRYSQEIRFCDMRHNVAGYSGTSGNAVHLHDNNFYSNALGFTTDVFTAAGHPGFPQDSVLLENNRFFSNNFNPYLPSSDVEPTIPVPVGTAMWIAGGNENVVRNNRFYDNWRRGAMVFAVPDAVVCSDPSIQLAGCEPGQISTSYNNRFHGNRMGVSQSGGSLPNGLDFWWDSFPGNTGNCWFANIPAPGKSITSSPPPPLLPNCNNGQNPETSVGTGSPNEAELVQCLAGFSTSGYDPALCPWFKTPPKPSG